MKNEQFRQLRRLAKMTQKDIAEFLSVSHATVKSWESGSNPVQESSLRNLKAYLVLAGKLDVQLPDDAKP